MNHICGTLKPAWSNFRIQVGYFKAHHKDDRTPLKGCGQDQVTHFKFRAPNDISGTAEARIVKFCMQLAY